MSVSAGRFVFEKLVGGTGHYLNSRTELGGGRDRATAGQSDRHVVRIGTEAPAAFNLLAAGAQKMIDLIEKEKTPA